MKAHKIAKAAASGDMSAAVSENDPSASFEPTHYILDGRGRAGEKVQVLEEAHDTVNVFLVRHADGTVGQERNSALEPIPGVYCHARKFHPEPTHILRAENGHTSNQLMLDLDGKPVAVLTQMNERSTMIDTFTVGEYRLICVHPDCLEPIKSKAIEKETRLGKMSNDRIHLTFERTRVEWTRMVPLVEQAFDVELPFGDVVLVVRPSQFGRFVALMKQNNVPFSELEKLNVKLTGSARAFVIDASRNPNTFEGEVL